MSDLSPLSGEERKLDFGAVRSVDDPHADIAPSTAPAIFDGQTWSCLRVSCGTGCNKMPEEWGNNRQLGGDNGGTEGQGCQGG